MLSDLVGKPVLVKLPNLPVQRGTVIEVSEDPKFPVVVLMEGGSRLPVKIGELIVDE